MSKLTEFCGIFEIEIEGKKIEVKPKKRDKWTLMKLTQKAKTMEIEDYEKLDVLLDKILKESDPEASDEEREAFLLRHSETMIGELSIVFGWTTREKMNELIDTEVKKNLKEGEPEAKKSSEDSS